MRFTSFQLNIGSKIFKALSEEARIRILYLVYQNEEMCISDLEQILDYTQSKTSRHINYLRNSGILSFRTHEQWVFYSIKEQYIGVMSQVLHYMEKDATIIRDLNTFKTLYANNILSLRKIHTLQRKYKLPEL
jgi:ArsR family transcriptional regulator